MKIIINEAAAAWFEENIDFSVSAYLRFYPSLARGSDSGFSFAIFPLIPTRPHTVSVVHDIIYYIEEGDQWIFENKDLVVTLDERGPVYSFE